jgi:hypothetical protein
MSLRLMPRSGGMLAACSYHGSGSLYSSAKENRCVGGRIDVDGGAAETL